LHVSVFTYVCFLYQLLSFKPDIEKNAILTLKQTRKRDKVKFF